MRPRLIIDAEFVACLCLGIAFIIFAIRGGA